MSESGSSSSPLTPSPPGQDQRPPHQNTHVIRVEAQSGGIWKAVTFIIGLLLFGGTFLAGIGIGAMSALAMKGVERVVVEQTYREGARRNRIAILPIEGIILDGRARFVHKAVDQILDDPTIRAVVLRVDSPGGTVTASDHIWYQVNRLRDAGIPVVASYGGVSASGGYYVSCHADHIFAEDTTITGSIGVIAQLFLLEELMNKIGIEPVTLVATHSPEKDTANNPFRDWDAHDRQQVIKRLDAAYDIFRKRVRAGRGHIISTDEALDEVTAGLVYTARQALDNGLIDSIGYLDDAIAQVEQLANLRPGEARVIRYVEPTTIFGGPRLGGGALAPGRSLAAMTAEEMRELATELTRARVMFLMP